MKLDIQALVARFKPASGVPKQRGTSKVQDIFERLQFSMSPSLRAEFYEMLSALVADGKPLDASIRELKERYVAKKRPMAGMLVHWLSTLDEGKSFGEAVKGYAADTEATIIAATDKSGALAEGFKMAAGVARAGAEIRSAVMNEMRGPLIQLAVLFAVMLFFSIKIAPSLTGSIPMWAFDDNQRALFQLTDSVARYWFYAVPVMVAVVAGVIYSVPRYTGALRPYLNKIPPWSIYRTYSSASFMISLSALITAGVSIESALRFIRQQSPPWLQSHLSIMVGRMRSGTEQGAAMDTGLLSNRVSDMVAVLSNTSDFDAAIATLGAAATKDGLISITAQARLLKGISTALVGFMVSWILTSVMAIGEASQRASDNAQAQSQQQGVRH
jgi:toxin co-regulated pilus biosynthesis protein E